MKRIGITGGIGSGKSEVTDHLRRKGYTVIDADEVAREAAAPGEPAMLRLQEEIGGGVFFDDGSLDRQKLAKIMFSDPDTLKTVNEIFHGDIKDRIESYVQIQEKTGDQVIFLSVPLLFETNADLMVDKTWLVTADEDVRLRRVVERDDISSEDVQARMASQMPEDEKKARADIIIENNGTIEELQAEVDKLLSDNTIK